MPRFIAIPIENDRTQFINLDRVRVVNDHPDEDGVRVDFDGEHHLYLDRGRAEPLLALLALGAKNDSTTNP